MREKDLTFETHKVALIDGPPGVGKSALARVIAKHCGYQVIEVFLHEKIIYKKMSASEDRTKEKLMQRVFDATQLQRLDNKQGENKPTCLILDEIDSASDAAGRSAINALVNFILGKGPTLLSKREKVEDENSQSSEKPDREENFHKEKQRENDEQDNDNDELIKEVDELEIDAQKDKKKMTRIVKRPIICICNDLYAKCIAPLRKIAVIFHVKSMDKERMPNVLKKICEKERVLVGMELLQNLCRQTKYDMRNCLNSLQLAAAQSHKSGKHKLITRDMLFYRDTYNLINSKDRFQGIFEIWDEVMSISHEKGRKSVKQIKNSFIKDDNPGFILDGIYHNFIQNSSGDLSATYNFLVFFLYSY